MANGIVGRSQGYVADQTQLLQIAVDGLTVYNQTADPIISDFCQDVYHQQLRVSQAPKQFNRHSDGGAPEAQRQSYRLINAPLQDFDAGTPWTVIGLQDALPSDIQSDMDAIMAGDVERMEMEFFRCLFTKQTAGSVGTAYQASFYSGETDVPNYKNNTFFGTAHNHYKGLNTTTLALSHLQEAARNIREHGFGLRPNSLVAWFHTDQQDDIENLLNITVASSLNSPGRQRAQDEGGYGTGLPYAGIEIAFNDNVPTGYFAVVDRTVKPLARRLHLQPQYRGLQMYGQSFDENFPLAGKNFLNRYGFVVQRLGAGVAYQLVGSTSYTNPTFRLAN
jgi:hypothetical protein